MSNSRPRSTLRTRACMLAAVAFAALALGACGGDDDAEPSGDGAAREEQSIKVAIESPWSLAYLPTSLAVDRLAEEGVEVEVVEFVEPDAMAQALAAGDVDVASTGAGEILAAIDGGLPVKAFLGLTAPDFVLVADSQYAECSQLDGRPLGVHSQQDIFGTAIEQWIESECPGTEPEKVVLPGSENRVVALREGQLAASPLGLLTATQLTRERPDEFEIVDSFGFPENVQSAWMYARTEWLEGNPELVQTFSDAYTATVESIYEDPTAAIERAQELIPETDPELLADVTRQWAENQYWTPEAGLEPEAYEATLEFLSDTMEFETPKPYEEVVHQSS